MFLIFIFYLSVFLPCYAQDVYGMDAYTKPLEISEHEWNTLQKYFLPDNHPLKNRLDRFFGHSRATESLKSFEKAGFLSPKLRQPTNIVLGRHPSFKGYLFKVFLDSQPPVCEWCNWVKRIEGAYATAECINRHGFKHFFVPKKWIYKLPIKPASLGPHPKHFILVVEDACILSRQDNLKAFQTKINREVLLELYTILSEVQLIDSVYPDNIPFTKKGKIAFIDTEHYHCGESIRLEKLTRYFCPEMQNEWKQLINANH